MLFLFLFLTCLCRGNVDELKEKLNKAKKNEKIEIAINLSEELIKSGKYEEAISYLEDAEKIIERKPNLFLQSEIEFLFGEVNYYLDNNSEAIDNYRLAAQISLQGKNNKVFGQSYYKIGLTYYYLNFNKKALNYLDTALKASIDSKDQLLQGKVFEAFARVNREMNELDKAIKHVNKAIEIYLIINDINGLANSYGNLGWIYYNLGENQKSIFNYNQSVNYWIQLGDKEGVAIQNVNIGNVYWKLGDFEKAIEFQQNALKYFEEIEHKQGIANSLNNIGICYENLIEENQSEENIKNLKNALSYYEKALQYRIELNDSFEISNSYLNIANIKSGIVHEFFIQEYGEFWEDSILRFSSDSVLSHFKEPINLYMQSLEIKESINDIYSIGLLYHNLGKIYYAAGLYDKSGSYLNSGLDLSRQTQNTYLEAYILSDIGNSYDMQKKFYKAIEYYLKSLEISESDSYNNLSKHNYLSISNIYEKLGNIDKSYKYYKLFTQIKDEIVNKEKYKQIAELETRYQTEKKEQEIALLNKDNELQKNKVKQARVVIFIISIGGILIIFFLIVVYRQFLEKRKANLKLKAQNKLIKKQKEDITDSITYASRIQTALLPPKEVLDHLLKDYFILFLPKDIVSGDFYWVTKSNNKVITIAADCTGHGVPGAFMSMLGISFLNEIVNKKPEIKANEILSELRQYIIKSLRQSMQSATGKDGMDLALTIIDRENMTLEFAGAFNPLIICRNGELIEQKGDRMPVGIHFKHEQPFKNYVFELKNKDMIYTFSDGFQDQFGGTDKRKFMIKRLKELLLDIYNQPVELQKEILQTTHDMWKGAYPQLDDIIVMGVRI